jgi:hypothetical protein
MGTTEDIIAQTKKWIADVVIGCNFCPFASVPYKKGSIHYAVEYSTDLNSSLQALMLECQRLDEDESIETILLIFPEAFADFDDYLHMVEMAEELMDDQDYEGIYQVASFHPDYRFADSMEDDPANYTNRSVYPMLHLLREESLEKAIDSHPDVEGIPERNIEFARGKGLAFMKLLRDTCLTAKD